MLPILTLACAVAVAGASDLRFHAADGGEFQFDTGVLRGTLHGGGKSLGLLPVVYIPTGATLTRSMGLFGHYRVFSANHRYGTGAWHWPSEAALREDGSVETHWPAAADRPFEMWAVYRWSGPATLDLETRVRPSVDLQGFESFLASYFAESFTDCLVYMKGHPATKGKRGFLAAEKSYGDWQMFPRDDRVLALINDGRWNLEPNPVKWVIMPALARPVGVRREGNSGITAIMMAAPEDCFAIATPQQGDSHYSLYLSLFGRTIRAGETARARARLVISPSLDERQILKVYGTFVESLRRNR